MKLKYGVAGAVLILGLAGVAAVYETDQDQALQDLDLELISATLSQLGTVRFVDNADAESETLFEESPPGVAVVSVDRILLLDDRAEVELRYWCGSVCAVFLTYEAVPDDNGWTILGTIGPIAMS